MAGRDEVDVRAVPGDDAGRLHLGQPRLHRGPGDPGEPGQLEVADPGMLAQRLDQRDIQCIHAGIS
jgi:hypothetical protein